VSSWMKRPRRALCGSGVNPMTTPALEGRRIR
jgi:hypothetical protein